jgi:hypothetical protein
MSKKTTTYYVGLVALAFGLYYIVQFLFSLGSLLLNYLALVARSPTGLTNLFPTAILAFVPSLAGAVIFLAVGIYIMRKGTVEEPPTPLT